MAELCKIPLTFLVSILILVRVGAQEDTSRVFHFPQHEMSLGMILQMFEDQSNIYFSYNSGKIKPEQIIFLPDTLISYDKIMTALSFAGMEVIERGNHIILKPVKNISLPVLKPDYFTIAGFVRDAETKESLIGASVSFNSGSGGTISNGYGFFSITLEEGMHSLHFSYIGYEQLQKEIDLTSGLELDILLNKKLTDLEEVVIHNNLTQHTPGTIQTGNSGISLNVVKKIPGFMGEKDVIKGLQSIPGINFYSDGSTIFHVRGGARDQNLILIDEAPVYNPAHMLGFFSVFSPHALNSVQIYRGDMPAMHGGRLSSVIDIKTREGNMERLMFSGTTGPVASTLNLEAPVFGKKGSFYISGRRSHLRWFLGDQKNKVEQLYFSDLNVKTNYRFNSRNRLYFSFYNGNDRFRNRETRLSSNGISWQNFAGNLRWNHVFGDRLFTNTSLIVSNYDYNLYTSYQLLQRWNAGISLLALKSDFSFYINPSSTLRYGFFLGIHQYFPGNFYSGNNPAPLQTGVPNKFTRENVVYVSHEQKLGEKVEVHYGFRAGRWINLGETNEFSYGPDNEVTDTMHYQAGEAYHSSPLFEPRFSIAFGISPQSEMKLSYTRNSQYEFLISNSISPFTSLEIWLPAGPNIKPMVSDQLSMELNFLKSDLPFSVTTGVFYKTIWNYISYKDHAYMIFNPFVETQLIQGKGKAWGTELIIRRNQDKWNGWISWSYSRVHLKIPGINGSKPFPARYDRPHQLSLFSELKLSERWALSLNWIFTSGSPFTTPTGYYYYLGHQVPYYNERNNDRLPDYHRLDVSTEIRLNKPSSNSEHLLNISLFNLYGRKNPFNINYNKMVDETGNILVPADYSSTPELITTMMYLFRLVPSINYSFRF